MASANIASAAAVVLACLSISAIGQSLRPSGPSGDDLQPRFIDSSRQEKLSGAFPAIDALMAQRMVELNLPGLVYGIVIDGELVVAKGLGFRDLKSREPVDAGTVFRIASMTKSFTALAILDLRDAGKLSLEDPIAKHVPELASLALPTRDSGPLTIRHLLTHSGGFPQDDPIADRQMALSNAQFSDLLRDGVPFSNPPGIAFEYSNLGYAILGRIVAKISGTPYQTYVERQILRPLGMTDTYWERKAAPVERLAVGYKRIGKEHAVEELVDGGDSEFAAMGALLMSSRDLARWIGLMLSAYPPRNDAERPPALRRTLREMQFGASFPRLFVGRPMAGAPTNATSFTAGYGLFAYRDCRFTHGVTHAGGLPGFGSQMRWLPEHGVGVFAMANTTYAPMGRLTSEILGILEETGGLGRRVPMPSRALLHAVSEIGRIVDAWEDERATRIAAPNFFLETPLESRREAVKKAREGLGACRAEPVKAENALRGTFRMNCEKGWIDVTLTLAPTQPPRVQHLSIASGRPPSAALMRAVEEVTIAFARGGHNLRLAPSVDRQAVGATLENAHVRYGACRVREVMDGDGAANARVRLNCDRGDLVLSIRTEGELLASIALTRPNDAVCVP